MSYNIKMYVKNSNNENAYNLPHEELTQIIQNIDKIDIKEINPTTQNINKSIYEEDLGIVVDELINLTFKDLNKGNEDNVRKQHILDYIDKHNVILQEIYNWLLNNQNHSNSIYLLGYFNYHGIVTDNNKQKASILYQIAAELENIVAQLELANMYIYGKGIKKDFSKAFELSKKLAEKNNPNAINRLGYCYDFGIGIKINKKKAFELYQKAADLGNSNGMNNLGSCYEGGFGTYIDKQKAFELYHKAAKIENDYAQYNLAVMYENGNVIKKDLTQAIHWYKKSANQGHKYAQKKLKKLLEK
ncbi:hypothetical protein RclHR1_10230007 [Rhizophagus clarus]|uniref:Kinase-like domain-containing protein n=1 Tax=Rhizophagus clarus TaxID=94130 RepID=A0A2Z6Q1B1_9GLOM|nr:hypothetical protein RclHR1_10230007 [Rhizophagus clarus]GES91040.1 kinase-like domain-containing protein [Rhizophagus clarus]